jgi:hypothetical protein
LHTFFACYQRGCDQPSQGWSKDKDALTTAVLRQPADKKCKENKKCQWIFSDMVEHLEFPPIFL